MWTYPYKKQGIPKVYITFCIPVLYLHRKRYKSGIPYMFLEISGINQVF